MGINVPNHHLILGSPTSNLNLNQSSSHMLPGLQFGIGLGIKPNVTSSAMKKLQDFGKHRKNNQSMNIDVQDHSVNTSRNDLPELKTKPSRNKVMLGLKTDLIGSLAHMKSSSTVTPHIFSKHNFDTNSEQKIPERMKQELLKMQKFKNGNFTSYSPTDIG